MARLLYLSPAWITFPSKSGSSLYPSLYAMSTCPWGYICMKFQILWNTYCLAWDEQTRNFGSKGGYSGWRGEGASSGIFQDLLGLCWHPAQLCYRLQLGTLRYLRGILGCELRGRDLSCLIYSTCTGLLESMVYIRMVLFFAFWGFFCMWVCLCITIEYVLFQGSCNLSYKYSDKWNFQKQRACPTSAFETTEEILQ